AADEATALRQAVAAVRHAGLPCPVASGGSTPTAALADDGVVTELRPGVYAFNDAQQLRLGSCRPEDVALVVLATVVSVPAVDRFVLDAGSKALGADRPVWMGGYGLVPSRPGAVVEQLSEHHAVVALERSAPAGPPAVGSRVAVVPNHVCAAVNLADELVVVDGGAVVDRWSLAPRSANR
ncbi:MAG: type III PLP-dependent enzyme domain-containing protein, partial [Acidimicrobiales bacterium]